LQIDDDIIQLFIEKDIDKKFWSHVDVNIVFDKCHYMCIDITFVDYTTTPEFILYDKIREREYDCNDALKYAAKNNIKLNTYHHDLILEKWTLHDKYSKDYIIEAINDKKYNITKNSIFRISSNIDRYKIYKMFDKFIN
jgi:hypothetical protein